MEPSFAMNSNTHCFPIIDVNVIQDILNNPPDWIDNIKPLIKRTSSVIENTLADCHVDEDHFKVRKRYDSRIVPKTLVCHDYKGGYKEDRFIYEEKTDVLGNSYTFYNWSQIDIFVYFSHYFITIPPVSWINAGHKNGVKVLGTLITEFKDGEKMCKTIFKDMYTMENFARSLAVLTKTFKFDGWLLNIENPVADVDILRSFVSLLTYSVHMENPDNLVIWYDSVTTDGKLQWQNELNASNQDFFNSCDGIFLNYVWTEPKLIKTAELAKHRNYDVYVGIDVFGRNTFGGGNFNCYKAAEVVRKYNLSMAIFAPGWTHETLTLAGSDFFETFVNRDTAFWKSLAPYMYTHPVNRVFSSGFHIGLDKDYFNLFKQQHQLSSVPFPEKITNIPQYSEILPLKNSCDCVQHAVSDFKSYMISTKSLRKNITYVHNLFTCDINLRGNTLIYLITKGVENPDAKLSLVLLTSNNGSFKKIKLLSKHKGSCLRNTSLVEVNPSTNDELIKEVAGKFADLLNIHKCHLNVYTLSVESCDILEIGAIIDNGSSIHLCGFGIEKENPQLMNYFFNNV